MRQIISRLRTAPVRFLIAAFTLFLSAVLLARPLLSQTTHPGPSRAKADEVAGYLEQQPSGFGRPCSDRASWAPLAGRLESFVDEAQHVVKIPLPRFDSDAYLQFSKTGDRQPMEKNANERNRQLIPLVLAECVEYKGSYVPHLAEVMDSLAAAPSWTLSAHDPQLLNLHGDRYYVDLGAADLADNLAEALYLLGDKLPATTRSHVLNEMERHVFAPMRSSFSTGGKPSDHNGNWWLYADMNWNAVCLKGVTGAALAVLPSVEDRALFVAAAEDFIHHYENGFNPDGYDTEGLTYWNYGFSHFIELRENLVRVTGGKIDLLRDPKMRKVALFGTNFPMMPGNAAAFGDAGVMPQPDRHLLEMIEHIFQIPASGNGAKEVNSSNHEGLTAIALDLFPLSDDTLPTPPEFIRNELYTYYSDSGVLVSKPAPGQNIAVTIKAGGNTTHSHNDIGSFVIGLYDVQPVGDPGGPKFYTAATFGPHRLDARLLNSFGHPVPEIDGQLQVDATTVKTKVLSHAFSAGEDRIAIDLTAAYRVAQLEQLTRTLVHSRRDSGSIVVSDEFRLTKPAVIRESLPTYGIWQKLDEHTLLFSLNGRRLRVTIDAPKPVTFTETAVDSEGREFKRVSAQVVLETSGTVTMHFTPAAP